MQYATGRWHTWDGKSEAPFDINKADHYDVSFDKGGRACWKHQGDTSNWAIVLQPFMLSLMTKPER